MNKKDAQKMALATFRDDLTNAAAEMSQVVLCLTSGEERDDLLRRVAAIEWQLCSVMGIKRNNTFEDFCDGLIDNAKFLRSKMPKEIEEIVTSL